MANPQKENGFTPIANEILDEIIKLKLNGTQFKIIMAVWRYTYGFNRKEHSISETFLSKAIGVARRSINREIKPLFEMKILIIVKNSTYSEAAIIKFNKNYEEWQQVSIPTTGDGLDNRCQNSTFTGVGLDTSTGVGLDTQERKYKTNKEKDDFNIFFESVWKLYPNKKGKQAVSTKNKKELKKNGYDLIAKCINNYITTKDEWRAYMDGSTFFNGRWKEFIETVQPIVNKPDDIWVGIPEM